MPSRDEVLRKILKQQEEILNRLDRMEQAEGGDPWLKDFDLTGSEPEARTPIGHTARAPAEDGGEIRFPMPPDWHDLNEDQRAAYLRIAAEGGQPGPEDFLQDQETITVELADGAGAEFPKPSPEAKAKWAETAQAVGENYAPSPDSGCGGTPEQVIEWYKHGGPLWLAAYDHQYLMGLPPEMRAVMVQTVNWYAPKEAQLIGRDILRVGTEAAKDFALEDVINRLAH